MTEILEEVIQYAQENARRNNCDYVTTEHLLLALLNYSGIVKSLKRSGITSEKIKSEIEKIVGESDHSETDNPILSPRTMRIIELSKKQAQDSGLMPIDIFNIMYKVLILCIKKKKE